MPILEPDSWRQQFYVDVACPDGIVVPTKDLDAYPLNPRHAWVYDKLRICQSQGIQAAPHGVEPPFYPVFSKPVFNLRGMGTGSRVIENAEDMDRNLTAGHFWSEILEGPHISTDMAVVEGKALWHAHARGIPLPGGAFDYWEIFSGRATPAGSERGDSTRGLAEKLAGWIERNLAGYTGMVNIETLGGTIIEAHLRHTDQWPDLYGEGWVERLVTLHEQGRWPESETALTGGYSVVFFGPHRERYDKPAPEEIEAIRRRYPSVSSIQLSFNETKPCAWHAMPDGGFRLAIVNTHDLETGRRVRERLALRFWSTQKLTPGRRRAKTP